MKDLSPRPAPFLLSTEHRRRLAKLAGIDPGIAKDELDRLEIILNDHSFITGVFEHPKPNEVRGLLAPRKGAGLKNKAEALAEALEKVPWQVSADYEAAGFVLGAFQSELQRFVGVSDAVLASYAGKKTARRPPQNVRDRHTIPPIADLFDHMWRLGDDGERDLEYLDNLCAFVSLALECAGIPCPDPGDTRHGEENQGRLRRLLKAHLGKRRTSTPRQPQRTMNSAPPSRTD